MPDTVTGYTVTARQIKGIDPAEEPTSDTQVVALNTTGTVTVSNTETLVNARPFPDAAVADNTNTLEITLHDNGLIRFHDVLGNVVTSRQVTLRKLVEKLIDCGIVA